MVNNSGGNGPNENGEQREVNAEEKRQDALDKGIKRLARQEFNENDAQIYNQVCDSDNPFHFSTQQVKDLHNFSDIEENIIQDEHGKDLDKLTGEELKEAEETFIKEIKMKGFPIHRNRQKLQELFEKEYDLSSEEKEEIKKTLKNKATLSELKDLLTSHSVRQKFLKARLGEDNIISKEKEKDFRDYEMFFNWEDLSEDQKTTLELIRNPDFKPIDEYDLQVLFDTEGGTDVFRTPAGKKKFIEDFCPFFTLRQVINFNIPSFAEEGRVKEKRVEEFIKRRFEEYCSQDGIDLEYDEDTVQAEHIRKFEDMVVDVSFFMDNDFDAILDNAKLESLAKVINKAKENNPSQEKIDETLGKIKDTYGVDLLKELNTPEGVGKVIRAKFYDPQERLRFVRVKSFDKENNKLEYAMTGSEQGIYEQDDTNVKKVDLEKFFGQFVVDGLENKKIEFELFSKKVFEKKKKDGVGEFAKVVSLEEIPSFGNLAKEYESKYVDFEGRRKDFDQVKGEYRKKVEDRLKEETGRNNITEEELDAELQDDQEYLKLLSEKDDIVLKYQEEQELNKRKAERLMDEHDEKGKEYGFEAGTVFRVKNNKSKGFSVGKINNVNYAAGTVEFLTSGRGAMVYQLSDFFYALKDSPNKTAGDVSLEVERIGKVKDSQDLLDQMKSNSEVGTKYKDIEIENGKFIETKKDENNNSKTREVQYFYGHDKNERYAIKVINVAGDYATIVRGDYVDIKVKDGKEVPLDSEDYDKANNQGVRYRMNKGEETVLTAELYEMMDNFEMRPGKTPGAADEELPEPPKRKLGVTGLIGKYLDFYSVMDMTEGVTHLIDAISAKLKRGTDYKAAKFAGMFEGIGIGDVGIEMKMKIEAAQREAMDEAMNRLKSIDSWMACNLIKKWLLSKSSSEAEKEAAVIFMLQNYGTLYAKGELIQQKGNWIWYQALGGTVGDDVYTQTKAECEQNGNNFTEELAVFELIKKQCSGKKKPKRRSRLHKEFKGLRPQGIADENKKGLDDGTDGATIDDRVKMGISEMGGGTYNNAVGVLEAVINKGGDIDKVNAIPAVMLLSGQAYTMDSNRVGDKLKNMSDKGFMIPLTFMAFQGGYTDLFMDTVVQLSQDIPAAYPQFSGMHKEALSLKENAKSKSLSEPIKVDRAYKFWQKYGEVLIRALYQLNGQDNTYSKTDNIIFLEKDNPKKSIYKKYHHFLIEIMGKTQINYMANTAVMTDCYDGAGTSGIFLHKAFKQTCLLDQGGGFRDKASGKKMWAEIWKELDPSTPDGIKGRTLDDDPRVDLDKKRRLYTEALRYIIGGLLENHGSRHQAIIGAFEDTGDLSYLRRYIGIQAKGPEGILDMGVNGADFLKKSTKTEAYLKKIVDRILNGDSPNSPEEVARGVSSNVHFIETAKVPENNSSSQNNQEDDYSYGMTG
ncbi:MAG: hypothetical protein N4A38_01325 [Candidatus Gracilibacteria bacterium]|nr:hypothetical protein [Candidatus Gracilibacteria bacterium]